MLARYTIDSHDMPGYAVGYLADKIKPRMLMTTHMTFDPWLNEETVAEVRHHWEYTQRNRKKLKEMNKK